MGFVALYGNLKAEHDFYPIKQDPYTRFERISESDGLPSNRVLDIVQDSLGFMWFATENGLCRYDGYKMVVYQHKKEDPSSISNNIITCLSVDLNGDLWVGTEDGLNLFNRQTEGFRHFKRNVSQANSLNDNFIKALYSDANNTLWVETAEGVLHKLSIQSFEIKKFRHRKPHQVYYRYHSIYEDADGKLWIGGRGIPVTYFDRISEEFQYWEANPQDPNQKRDNDIACYFEDSNQNFWLAATDGAYLFNQRSSSFTKVLNSSAFSIIEDSEGNLWFGSSIGLLMKRKETNEFVNFRNNQDNEYSITHNRIYKIFEDRNKLIWVATSNGISIYSPRKNSIKSIRHIPNLENSLSGNVVTSILEDKNKDVWIGTQKHGLNIIRLGKEDILHIKSTSDINNGLSSNRISDLYEDRNGAIWVGLWSGRGFNKIDSKAEKIKRYAYDFNTLKKDWYNDFIELSDGRFFTGAWGAQGLMEFDRDSEKFTGFQYLNNSRPKFRPIQSIAFCNGYTSIYSDTRRLYDFNIQNQDFTAYFKGDPKDERQELFGKQKAITNIDFRWMRDLISCNNSYVLGASDVGILIHDPLSQSMSFISKDKDSRLLSNDLFSFFEYSSDTLCILSDVGLNFWSISGRSLLDKSLMLNEMPVSVLKVKGSLFLISNDRIEEYRIEDQVFVDTYSLNEEYKEVSFNCAANLSNDQILIGTNRGVCIFDLESSSIIGFVDEEYDAMQNWVFVNTLYQDHSNQYWIGTDIGLGKIDLSKDKIAWVQSDHPFESEILDYNIECIVEDDDHNLWLGSEKGVMRYHPESNSIDHLSVFGEFGLSSHLITSLLEDQEGNIWVGTSDRGLNMIDKQAKITHYIGDEYDDSGFQGTYVNAIYEDSKGQIWVATKEGLNRFELYNNGFEHFSEQDGLSHNEVKSIVEDDHEQLWISTMNGIVQFDLQSNKVIKVYDQKDGLLDNQFTKAAAKLSNGELWFGGYHGVSIIKPENHSSTSENPKLAFTEIRRHNELMKTEIVNGDTIWVVPETKFFSIEFACLEYTNSLHNKYRYKLLGSFDDWIELGGEHKISFTDLASGTYQLQVIGASSDGQWNLEGIHLYIVIIPPFWKTWWFMTSVVIFIGLVIAFIMSMKIKSLQEEKRALILEQKLLRTQMNPHFIFNVLAAVQGLIYQKDKKVVVNYLSKFASLMRSILNYSKEEMISLKDELHFIENYLKLQQLRFSNSFEYKLKVDLENSADDYLIPPMVLQPFIENAIEHGIRKKENGDGLLNVSIQQSKNTLKFTIEDNGIGITRSKQLKKDSQHSHKSVGMQTTCDRIRKFNGSSKNSEVIEIMDRKDLNQNESGTQIIFLLPFNQNF